MAVGIVFEPLKADTFMRHTEEIVDRHYFERPKIVQALEEWGQDDLRRCQLLLTRQMIVNLPPICQAAC